MTSSDYDPDIINKYKKPFVKNSCLIFSNIKYFLFKIYWQPCYSKLIILWINTEKNPMF